MVELQEMKEEQDDDDNEYFKKKKKKIQRQKLTTIPKTSKQKSFYVAIGTFTFGYILYRIHKSNKESGSKSFISDIVEKYAPSQQIFEERNAIHSTVLEKAAHDRHLFASQNPPPTYEVRFPE